VYKLRVQRAWGEASGNCVLGGSAARIPPHRHQLTINFTHPLWTAPAFQSTTHIESRDTLHHSSIYLLWDFATIAMPPKGSKCATSEAPGPNVKKNQHVHGSLCNHYTVDNWKGFLPKKILDAVLAVKSSGSKTPKMRTMVSTG